MARATPFFLILVLAFLAFGVAGSRAASPRHYVFAMNWEPAFCQFHSRTAECRGQTADSFAASHFTLHGLWPDPFQYCGVSPELKRLDKAGGWRALPALDLSPTTRAALDRAMPGTRSRLQRHEWLKHGTCSGESAETYFSAALRLLAAINASPLRTLFANRIGQAVSGAEIRAALVTGFGPNAGARARISCRRDGSRRLISGISIAVSDPISGAAPISSLIAAAPTTAPGCPAGIVDPAGP